ncbi:thymidine phosphorylase family protein [Alkalimarinus alittae]|uniref:Putative thymidine phosphorylase n=1 Tax=Alkalimarinus alittae TaxID=2961619 RepID=A0ABY6MZF0_9ALTE|nr:thymidine phosphorylase family protein [Alkalimarinus alittae]UZE95147.1 thymidine phosphorylase family protein [Alkalimarinus alittae]
MSNPEESQHVNFLNLRRMGIDTHQEPVIYMRQDCYVCRAEGFEAHSRINVCTGSHSIIATVNMVTTDILSHQEVGLSESAWRLLEASEGEKATFSHAKPAESMTYVRGKIYGTPLSPRSATDIINDIANGNYSDIQLASFVTSCAGNRLNTNEIISLTKAMVACGSQLDWGREQVMDKHCVGGLPGNRTTPIVVAIVAASGLIMPKTSSRAITSPAGTADTMETLTPVNLSLETMRSVVEKEGGCIAWGGSVSLSPADDILIRIEKALDLDSEGQLVASVISKKIAAGSTDVLIDIPIGATAKVRSMNYGRKLAKQLVKTGEALGIRVNILFSDGSQPVGHGIGPALEARDIIHVLKNHHHGPQDLRDRATTIAGEILEMGHAAPKGEGKRLAEHKITSGEAWTKFQAICEAQGGLKEPPRAAHTHCIRAGRAGIICYINNRVIAKLAKLAGAPAAPAAGLDFHVKLGDKVDPETPLFTIHSDAPGELQYAINFLEDHPNAVSIEEECI